MKKIQILFIVLLTGIFSFPVFSQTNEGFQESVNLGKQVNSSVRALSFYHDNYFLLYSAPVKFQISIQYRLLLPENSRDDTGFYFAYTQKSLWDLWDWENSAPFVESNYMPEIFYRYDYGKSNFLLRQLQFGLLHESNGMGKSASNNSRSWNRVYLEAFFHFSEKEAFIIKPRIWFPFGKDDNPDITDYEGYGDLTFEFYYFNHFYDSKLQVILRKGFESDWKKFGIEINNTIGPFNIKAVNAVFPVAIYLQLWHGYGETLLQYNQKETALRIGLGIVMD